MSNSFKKFVREQLLVAAQQYYSLISNVIIIKSSAFKYQNKYVIAFDKNNFLHLTGVVSKLKPADFFEKCINASIKFDDFDYDNVKNKTNIKNKLRCLVTISTMFDKELFVQEQFVKNRVICKVATSDGSFTIGFSGGAYYVYPKTVLNKNRLDESKPIIVATPLVIQKFKNK